MPRPYRVPIYPLMPVFIAIISLFAAFLYGSVYQNILLPTAILYAVAIVWYLAWGRTRILPVAPEEVAARIAQELERREGRAEPVVGVAPRGAGQVWLERLTGVGLVMGLASLGWMLLRRWDVLGTWRSEAFEVGATVALWSALFVLVGVVGFLSTRRAAGKIL